MRHFIEATIRALGFLTRLPISNKFFDKENKIANDAGYFPIAGFIIGLAACIILAFSIWLGLSQQLASLFSIVSTVALTGALHEDGLSDTADAFFVHKSIERRLEIMKDSHIGVYGTLAIIFCIAFRILILSSFITEFSFITACCAILMAETMSRAAMVCFWYKLPLARDNGTAAAAGKPDRSQCKRALALGLGIFIILGLPCFSVFSLIYAMILTVIFVFGFSALCIKKIGGYTGDTLGAVQQCLLIAIALGLFIGNS